MKIEELLKKIPTLPQRQDSTVSQLNDLYAVAIKLGYYDAADAVKSIVNYEYRNTEKEHGNK